MSKHTICLSQQSRHTVCVDMSSAIVYTQYVWCNSLDVQYVSQVSKPQTRKTQQLELVNPTNPANHNRQTRVFRFSGLRFFGFVQFASFLVRGSQFSQGSWFSVGSLWFAICGFTVHHGFALVWGFARVCLDSPQRGLPGLQHSDICCNILTKCFPKCHDTKTLVCLAQQSRNVVESLWATNLVEVSLCAYYCLKICLKRTPVPLHSGFKWLECQLMTQTTSGQTRQVVRQMFLQQVNAKVPHLVEELLPVPYSPELRLSECK